MAAPSQLSPNQASETAEATTKENKEAPDDNVAATPSTTTGTTKPEAAEEASTASTATLKDDPPMPTATTLKDDPPTAQVPPPPQELTYANTQASDAFMLAKHLLQEGDFDNALETIGEEMTKITSLLSSESQDLSVHESMAPLYYLYGTTLLYSIEESTDSIANAAMNNEQEEPDDSQIAWENLETARHIVQRMVEITTCQDLSLDLAQIHLRLGDLSKSNGHYVQAICDYQKCLEIRQPLLGIYHRKVASMYHALGLVQMLLASEGDKEDSTLTKQEIEEYRLKSIESHVACAKSFAGQIAFLCGASPEEITSEENISSGKTTGMDEAELALYNSSNIIRTIRERVKPLTTTSTEYQETVHEFKELLDEIQETIDEVEHSKEGIREVSHMKVKAKEAVASSDGAGAVENADGSTTTIGFGNVSVGSGEAAAPVASASATSAKPMMVIKKKKKRNADEDGERDKKMPAQGDTKRAKTTEE